MQAAGEVTSDTSDAGRVTAPAKTVTETSAPSHHERLVALSAFLPVFQAPGFEFGRWGGGEKQDDGITTMPHFSASHEVIAFVDMAYELGWVIEDFDWPGWGETPEAQRLREDPAAVAKANPEQLARLLTALIRVDRFVEGALASAFDSGLLTRITERASQLLEEAE